MTIQLVSKRTRINNSQLFSLGQYARRLSNCLLAFLVLAFSAEAGAQRAFDASQDRRARDGSRGDGNNKELSLVGGFGVTDNIGRRAESEAQDSAFYEVGANTAYTIAIRSASLSVFSDVLIRDFTESDFDAQVFGDIDANLNVDLVPDQVSWRFSNNFGQVRQRGFLPVSPDNIQDVNTFSTGPTVRLPLGRRSAIGIEGTYATTTFEEDAQADNETQQVDLFFERVLSPARSLGLIASTRTIQFDDGLDTEFDIDSYAFFFSANGARSSFGAEVGYNVSDGEAGSNGGPLVRLNVGRQVGAYSNVSLTVSRQISDTRSLFTGASGTSVARVDQNIASNSVITRTNASLGFLIRRPRDTYDIGLSWISDEFESSPISDIETYELDLGVSRSLSSRSALSGGIRFLKRNLAGRGERNDEWSVGTDYQFAVATKIYLTISLQHNELHATIRDDFEENLVLLNAEYRFSESGKN